jgi:2-keto-4-pentenoate hydratase/2-oxohepta-3-ene-1,7-dioic acid hydratase in catechol pathway
MRLASYLQDGASAVGIVDHDRIVDLADCDPGLPRSMRALLEMDDGLDRVARAPIPSTGGLAADEVAFAPVVSDSRAIWCAALTFASHVGEAEGRKAPYYPLFFPRVLASQVGHRQPIVRPAVSRELDYEGELALVIGRPARHVALDDALSYVAGYSCYNEGSVRDWQRHTPQIAPGKNFAATGAFGPWLVTPDEFGDPYAHTLTTRVNGEVRQQESLDALLFRIEYLIHYLSAIHPLAPGDVIVCGTPGGVGLRREPPVFLEPGDTVAVEIDGIGTLENPVRDESPARPTSWRPRDPQGAAQ